LETAETYSARAYLSGHAPGVRPAVEGMMKKALAEMKKQARP
jgi:hypothetical protein